MSEHTCREFTPGCYRCDLNRDEEVVSAQFATAPKSDRVVRHRTRVTRDGVRYRVRPMDAEGLAEIERLHAEHPTDRCDLFRTPTGRCTCEPRP